MTSSFVPIRNALISVSDKTGLEVLARHLSEKGTRIFSTGGTYQFLKTLSLPVESVEALTQMPEILDGRVKTLHPHIFAGILARRNCEQDLKTIEKSKIVLFDLVVVNLYPFQKHIGKPVPEQVEQVDIGGPSLVRAASKNHEWVTVLSDPSDYSEFLSATSHEVGSDLPFRRRLAQKSFERVSEYDRTISEEWSETKNDVFPQEIHFGSPLSLRYGENPHQKGVWCGTPHWKQHQGKELSYNNFLDAEAGVRLVSDFSFPACCIIKHNNPCGAAWNPPEANHSTSLFMKALACDPKSAFGGIVVINYDLGPEEAKKMSEMFLECIVAPSFTDEARFTLKEKSQLRLIEYPSSRFSAFEVREALGGWLLQERNQEGRHTKFEPVTVSEPPHPFLLSNMRGLWLVCKHTRSNAIVIGKDHQTWGIGGGQVSRIDALEIALSKAKDHLENIIIASDAFFPFRDSIDRLAGLNIAAIIQPGGSRRDLEVIEACKTHQIPLYFTGERHFRH